MNVKPKGTVTLPRVVSAGLSVLPWANEVNRCLQQLRDRIITVPNGGGNTGASSTPWKLSVSFDDPDYKWRVSSTDSTITEGTNGTAIDLSSGSSKWTASSPIKFDTDTTITVTSWIVLECAVDSSFILDDFTFKAVTKRANAQEVKFLTTGTLQQDTLRLLIGKVIFTSGVPRVVQAADRQQFVDYGLFNSRAIKCYNPPQLDPDLLA